MQADLLGTAIKNAKEVKTNPSLVTPEELQVIDLFLNKVGKNVTFNDKQLYAILNITRKAARKAFKLHKQARRENTQE